MNRALEILSQIRVYGLSFLEDLGSWLISSPVAFVFCVLWLAVVLFGVLRVVMTWK